MSFSREVFIGYHCPFKLSSIIKDGGFLVRSIADDSGGNGATASFRICRRLFWIVQMVELKILDAVVLSGCCNMLQHVHNYLKYKYPFLPIYFIPIPRLINEEEYEYFTQESNKMLERLYSVYETGMNHEDIIYAEGTGQEAFFNGRDIKTTSRDYNSLLRILTDNMECPIAAINRKDNAINSNFSFHYEMDDEHCIMQQYLKICIQ